MKNLFSKKQEDGFALIMTVIIIAALGLALSEDVLWSSAEATRNIHIAEESYQAADLADACAETALEDLGNSGPYTGTATLSLGSGTCTYTVSANGSTDLINASSTVSTVVRKAQIYITVPQLQITSWQEVGSF